MMDQKKETVSLLWPVLLVVFNIFLFGPFSIYQGNVSEFQIPLLHLIIGSLVVGLLIAALLYFIGRLLKNTRRYISVLLALGVMIWLQGNIFVWEYGLLDGQGIDWKSGWWRGFIDGGVWVLLIFLAVIFYRSLSKIATFTSILLISLQLVLLIGQSVQSPDLWTAGHHIRTGKDAPPEIFEFSADKNVILIILDGFQSDIFHEIVQENPSYSSIFRGFTFFKNTMGCFPTTKMSIPAILTTKVYKNQSPMSRFMSKKLHSRTIHSQVKKAGFQVDLICGKIFLGKDKHFSRHFEIPRPYSVHESTYYFSNLTMVLDLVFFRQSPHFLKSVVYDNQSWFLQKLVDKEALSSFHYISHKRFFDDFIHRMTVSQTVPVYKYMHLGQTHAPVLVNDKCEFTGKIYPLSRQGLKRQGICALHQVTEFFDKLKALGIYNSSILVIFADHGANIPVAIKNYRKDKAVELGSEGVDISRIMGSAAPLLLIKKAGEEDLMKISEAPAMLSDLPITICSLLHLNCQFHGQSIFDLDPAPGRIRKFYYYKWKHKSWKKEYFDQLQEYIVEGPIFDLHSWRKGKMLLPKYEKSSS